MKRPMHLNLFIQSRGHHEASWRHPASSPLALTDIQYVQALARQAELARLQSQADDSWLAATSALEQHSRSN